MYRSIHAGQEWDVNPGAARIINSAIVVGAMQRLGRIRVKCALG